MTDIRDLRREADGKKPYEPMETNKPRRNKNPRPKRGAPVAKTPLPPAKLWSSDVAESWMASASLAGFEPPYNVNYLATEIEIRASRDPHLQKLREEGREDDVHRWVAKMAELFWKTSPVDGFSYVRAGDTAGKVKEIFLVDVWEDLRQYAFDSLRAAYLKEHGRVKRPPEYLPYEQTEMHELLQKVRAQEFLAMEENARETTRELHKLDERTRAVLSSAKERKADS